jgi:hypothetical protein
VPTQSFICPECEKSWRAYVDDKSSFVCKCGKRILPMINGQVTVIDIPEPPKPVAISKPDNNNYSTYTSTSTAKVDKPLKQETFHEPAQSANTQKKDYSWIAMAFVSTLLLATAVLSILYAYEWYNKKIDDDNNSIQLSGTSSKAQSKSYSLPNTDYYPDSSVTERSQTSEPSFSSPIVYVHILNTYMNTNKMIKSTAYMNEANESLTLTSVDNSKSVIKILYGNKGVVDVRFYIDGTLEVDKTFYRRSDLENGNGTLIYTSKSGEITLSLSY